MAVSGPDVLCGRYEVRGVIGRGGMGEVRDGWDSRLERPIADAPVRKSQPSTGSKTDAADGSTTAKQPGTLKSVTGHVKAAVAKATDSKAGDSKCGDSAK